MCEEHSPLHIYSFNPVPDTNTYMHILYNCILPVVVRRLPYTLYCMCAYILYIPLGCVDCISRCPPSVPASTTRLICFFLGLLETFFFWETKTYDVDFRSPITYQWPSRVVLSSQSRTRSSIVHDGGGSEAIRQ